MLQELLDRLLNRANQDRPPFNFALDADNNVLVEVLDNLSKGEEIELSREVLLELRAIIDEALGNY